MSYEALIEATIKRGKEENKSWAGLVREADYPINIEGAAFREGGTLLLGLRFPVSADGCPVLVEIEGIERLFERGDEPPGVLGFWVVDAVGREGEIAGVRDLTLLGTAEGEELHLVTGNVDSRDKGSVLIRDYPGGHHTVATHFRSILPPTPTPAPSTPSSSASSRPCRAWRASRSPTEAASSTSPTRTRASVSVSPASWRISRAPPGRCAGSWSLMVIFHFTATSLGPRARTPYSSLRLDRPLTLRSSVSQNSGRRDQRE